MIAARLRIVRPGMLTTVQDLGRWGHQAGGVPVAGPMDVYSHRAANRLAGNHPDAAALEITLLGPELEASADLLCVVCGADFSMTVAGEPMPGGRLFAVPAGQRLRIGDRRYGARGTLAVRGGLAAPATLGSRATSIISRMGPFGGRALAAGDELAVGDRGNAGDAVNAVNAGNAGIRPPLPLALPRGGARLRVIAGPHDAMFTRKALDVFFSTRYIVTPNSNRMGYRLEGTSLEHAAGADILSDATPMGSVQVPKSGQPILLMADRQTTGGYPKIATVISADLPLAAQVAPGDWIEFAPCTRAAALDALKLQERRLAGHAG